MKGHLLYDTCHGDVLSLLRTNKDTAFNNTCKDSAAVFKSRLC